MRGQAILPGAAMFETALAAGKLALDWSGNQAVAPVALVNSGIPAPLLLRVATPSALTCVIDVGPRGATAVLQSPGGSAQGPAATHLSGQLRLAARIPMSASVHGPWGVLRRVFAGHQGASTGPWAAAAPIGALHAVQQKGSAFWAHPAVLDACFHVAPAATRPEDAARAPMRVPTALEAFCVPTHLPAADAWADVGQVAALQDGSVVASFGVSAGENRRATMLAGLTVKPARVGPAPTQRQAGNPSDLSESHMAYAVMWKVAVVAEGGFAKDPPGLRRPLAKWVFADSRRRTGNALALRTRRSGGGGPALTSRVSVQSLAAVKQVLASKGFSADQSMTLWTVGAHSVNWAAPGRPDADAPAAVAVSSLAAVGLHEFPSNKWQAFDVHPAATRARNFSGVATDEYGVSISAGAALRPQIEGYDAGDAGAPVTGELPQVGGSILVTGGLGGIGSLAGIWVAQHAGLHVVLLGRQGNNAPSVLTDEWVGCITAARCDVAASTEVSALTAWLRQTLPVVGILHAGGVSQDGTLPKQTSATMRAVITPKLDGICHLAENGGLNPLAAYNIFSSTSAIFGPTGQANYTAANAALNAWAESQQGTGGSCHAEGV